MPFSPPFFFFFLYSLLSLLFSSCHKLTPTMGVQVARSPYTGVWDCILRTWRHEGVGAFFRSFRTTVRTQPCVLPLVPDHFDCSLTRLLLLSPSMSAWSFTLLVAVEKYHGISPRWQGQCTGVVVLPCKAFLSLPYKIAPCPSPLLSLCLKLQQLAPLQTPD